MQRIFVVLVASLLSSCAPTAGMSCPSEAELECALDGAMLFCLDGKWIEGEVPECYCTTTAGGDPSELVCPSTD